MSFFFIIFAKCFTNLHIDMTEKKIYRVIAELGVHTFFAFNAIKLDNVFGAEGYCRFDGELMTDKGTIRIDRKNEIVGIGYDVFSTSMKIDKTEEVEDNIHMVCHNDLFYEIHIYICDAMRWADDGKKIFS